MKIAIPIRGGGLLDNNAIIENADKVISIVTLFKQQYHEKMIGFVNSSTALNKKSHNLISKSIRNFQIITPP
jgi:hypothetical protein